MLKPGDDFKLGKLHHVQLSIPRKGEDAAREFWCELLGLSEVEKPSLLLSQGGCWFITQGLDIHVGVDELFAPARKAHPAISVENIEALAVRLTIAKYPINWDTRIPSIRRFHSSDPFGNRLEFIELIDN